MTSETINSSTLSKHYVQVPRYYLIALGELGVRETAGAAATKRIVEYASHTTLKATSDEVAWCSSYACFCVESAGLESTKSAAAKSWLTWGKKVGLEPSKWLVGDVCVFTREGGGHVAFWTGERQSGDLNVRVLGGNQGNAVTIALRSSADLLDVRRLA